MENPFYEFDLTKELNLIDELNKLYQFSKDESKYNKLILRASIPEFNFENHMKIYDSYDSLLIDYTKIEKEWIPKNKDQYIGQLSLFGEEINWNDYPLIYNFVFKKTIELYGKDIIIKNINNQTYSIRKTNISNPLLTMYKKEGRLSPHKDGKSNFLEITKTVKPANILLYLNKDYKKEWGGCFNVDGFEVVPEFGKLIFLNFRGESDPEHSVSILNEDVNRIALLFNITYSLNQKEIWKIE